MTTPSADESALILTDCLKRQEPFFFVRYGDGAIEAMWPDHAKTATCDGERYTPELGADLLAAWLNLEHSHPTARVFAGDWQTASFGNGSPHNREQEHWRALTDKCGFELLHFETLLLMRESEMLVHFYRTVRADPRRKVYMGPLGNWNAGDMLGSGFFSTSMRLTLEQARCFGGQLADMDFDVLLYGAGLAGNIAAVECWKRHPERTYISLGSAMDPLFRGKSRAQQLPQAKLREMFRGML